MNTEEHLLTILNEECVEIAKEADKALRFGLDDKYPKDPKGRTNRERIVDELNDLAGVVRMMSDQAILPKRWGDDKKQKAKIEKVLKYLKHSKKVGKLK